MRTFQTGLLCLLALCCISLFSWKAAGWLMLTVNASPKPPAPFALLVREIHIGPVSPYEAAEGFDTKVEVVLDHTGPSPTWWGASINGLGVGSYGDEALYFQNGSRRQRVIAPRPWAAPFVWSPVWDESRQCYVAYYLVDLAHVPAHPGTVLLRGHLAVGMLEFQKKPLSPAVLVSVPVRQPGQIVRVPTISHDPMLTIEDVEMTKYTPTKAGSNGGMDTRVTVKINYRGRTAHTDLDGVTGYPSLTDDHNQAVQVRSMSFHGIQDLAEGENGRLSKGRHFQIDYWIQSQPGFTQAKTLTLTDFASVYDRWPLSYRIVLHDAKASSWTKPGPKPWFSHPRVLLAKGERPYI